MRKTLRDTLLRAADAGLYRVHWSTEILAETTRNLIADLRMSEGQAARLVQQMSQAFPEAVTDPPGDLIGAMTNHQKDRHVLATAIVARASLIVTENLGDFPASALHPYDIEARPVDEFLMNLFDIAPVTMITLLQEQADDCQKPPMTLYELLGILGKAAPNFVSAVRVYLSNQFQLS